MLSWLRGRRRRAILERPFPSAWEQLLRRNVLAFGWLEPAARERLRNWVLLFVAEKRFEGCGGMAIDDEVRVTIAAQAGLVTLGFDHQYLDGLRSVLVYPGDYIAPRSTPLAGGASLEWHEARLGETWTGGSMVLSWPRVLDGGRLRDPPRNVVIHESAHAIDMLDGAVDGVPPLPASRHEAWRTGMAAALQRLEETLDEGRWTPLDDYALDSPAEFFAVVSECFFQDPHRLARYDDRLYGLLSEAYRQDPLVWVPPGRARPRG
jgi:Mlc titration factor MtfA (ptsG expression regulator)